jgi:hypothetical protein
MSAAKVPTKDVATLVKLVQDARKKVCPALSVDTILMRPIEGMKVGLHVGSRQQKIARDEGMKVARVIDALVRKHPHVLDAIDEVLRGMLNARKRGYLNGKAGR